VLAFAAWAARWGELLDELRKVGVSVIDGLTADQSAVQVLVGDVTDQLPLHTSAKISVASSPTVDLELAPICELPARQAHRVVEPGAHRVHVAIPDVLNAAFAVTALRGFVSVLIITREADGQIDVQQHWNPIAHDAARAGAFNAIDDVKMVELAWRALQTGASLADNELDIMLLRKRTNPMFALIAGYRMFGTSHQAEFRGPPEVRPTPGQLGASPLWNMCELYPELPDVHVLAAMYDDGRRDQHYQRAMDAGIPVFAEGWSRLLAWLDEQAAAEDTLPPTTEKALLAGSVWTAFANPPAGVHVVTAKRSRYIEPDTERYGELDRLGRLERATGEALCSVWVLESGRVVCPRHAALMFAEQSGTSWVVRVPVRVRIGRTLLPVHRVSEASASSGRGSTLRPVVLEVHEPGELLVTAPHMHGGGMIGFATGLAVIGAALTARRGSLPKQAMPRIVPPEAGARCAVLGFPARSGYVSHEQFRKHFADITRMPHVMTGSIVSVAADGTFVHDCCAPEGTDGGPVIDLASGAIAGIQIGPAPSDGQRSLAVPAAWLVGEVVHSADKPTKQSARAPDRSAKPKDEPARREGSRNGIVRHIASQPASPRATATPTLTVTVPITITITIGAPRPGKW
jgi:hypothetical protein